MLKIGGPAFYRRSRPIFFGLLTGYVLGVIISTVVDIIWFPGMGHWAHYYK